MTVVKDVVNAVCMQKWYELNDDGKERISYMIDLAPLLSGLSVDNISVNAILMGLIREMKRFFDEEKTDVLETQMKRLFRCLTRLYLVLEVRKRSVLFGGFLFDKISHYIVPEEFEVLFEKLLLHWGLTEQKDFHFEVKTS